MCGDKGVRTGINDYVTVYGIGAVGGFLGDFWGILCGDLILEEMWGIIESDGMKMRG